MSNVEAEAAKIFERMSADVIATLDARPKLNNNDVLLATLQAVAREIAEHRLRTGST